MTVSQKLVLAGFGNIGQALAELIADNHPSAAGLRVCAVSDPRFGTVVDTDGVDPDALLAAAREDGSFSGLDGGQADGDIFEAIDGAGADTLVELTFTDLDTGEPATSHIRHALSRGLNVSTTNKGPIALHLDELETLAVECGASIFYEGTVMSGTPAILLAAESIKAAGLRSVTGILNGTTNYMIGRMEDGIEYDKCLREAQDLGYAEADPSGDVDGIDAAGKLSILARVLADTVISPSDVDRRSLQTLSADDVAEAAVTGRCWRYVAVLERASKGWNTTVAPRLFDSDHPLAAVRGATNAITFDTDLLGEVTLTGPGAGRTETAYSVLNDLSRMTGARE